MQEAKDKTKALISQTRDAMVGLDIDVKSEKLWKLRQQSATSDFWEDSKKAKDIMQEISALEEEVTAWQKLQKDLQEVSELLDLGDDSLLKDIEKQLEKVEEKFNKLKKDLAYSGPYDQNDVILNIYAGAGGTDAQDWAGMLLRMYVRYAEKSGYKVKILDESTGEEAGIKSASLQVSGKMAFGKLKGEHGVHRLVRLSPFNADNLRQTSFAKVDVLPKIDEPSKVPLDDKDLKIDVFRAGGHGGQSVNTTDSAVRVTHIPTGITTSIQNERSQIQNKETALTILRSRLAALQLEQHKETIAELKGPNQANEWGSQIRNYVLHPYKQVKDLRTKYETSDPDKVLDGGLEDLIKSFAENY